jgi:hypothetical protein
MNAKKILTIVLLLFVVASFGYLVIQESSKSEEATGATAPDDFSGNKLIAFFFHPTERCVTCRKIEEYAYEALTEGFPEAFKEGLLVWRVVNFSEPSNEHFIFDYQLVTTSVVLVDVVDGEQQQWKELPEVWSLVDDQEKFLQYIREETQAYLEDK